METNIKIRFGSDTGSTIVLYSATIRVRVLVYIVYYKITQQFKLKDFTQ